MLAVEGDIREGVDRPSISVAAAVPKGDRVDWMVQKLTELGVARIVLLRCERSVVNWEGERGERQLERLRRISIGALQQSRGLRMPSLEGPISASEVLHETPIAEPGGEALSGDDRSIAIGPEGGWSDAELATAARRVDLGPGVLRVETAAVTAAVLMTRVTR